MADTLVECRRVILELAKQHKELDETLDSVEDQLDSLEELSECPFDDPECLDLTIHFIELARNMFCMDFEGIEEELTDLDAAIEILRKTKVK